MHIGTAESRFVLISALHARKAVLIVYLLRTGACSNVRYKTASGEGEIASSLTMPSLWPCLPRDGGPAAVRPRPQQKRAFRRKFEKRMSTRKKQGTRRMAALTLG